jgi:membrane-bound lytic murein transglycosylase D
MLQKFIILCILSSLTFTDSFAGAGNNSTNKFPNPSPTDTTAEKKEDSLIKAAAITDPKQGFKDLFVSSTRADGVTMEELNPMAISFVEDYMEKFGKKMENIKSNGRSYFNMMDVVLEQHGLPKELKYLAVIESYLNTNARSGAGAAGPWQFMPVTARNMGLKVNKKVDERFDVYKSTHAASRYLTSLYSLYGDWLLVIAAYNGGPGAVNSAMRRSKSKDFWELQRFLPTESRNHVKKFIATHYMMEGEGGITTLTKAEATSRLAAEPVKATPEEIINTKTQSISGRYLAAIITKYISMDAVAFSKLNPDFDDMIASKGTYPLRLPNDKMDALNLSNLF